MKPWVATCGQTRERLSDYIDGDLAARTRTRVMRHLSRCGSVEQAPPAPATVRAVVERIEQEER
jgi:anti-sigma factor RsiW